MYKKEGQAKDFELAAILSVITGVSFTGDFSKIEQLMFYIFNSNLMGPLAIAFKREEAVEHILTIHPELAGIKLPKGANVDQFLIEQESIYGTHLPITRYGFRLPKNPEMTLKPNKKTSAN